MLYLNVTLKRIAELIPKDETGEFKHGAIKEFAVSIGYKSGNIVSMWFNGDSISYKGKLHEIAAKYNVSVEWLNGETDVKEKSPAPEGAELDRETIELKSIWDSADENERRALLEMARLIKSRRG